MDHAVVLAGRAQVPDHVVYRAFANETVVLNLHTGRYHGLNPSGARILETLEREASVAAAAARLAGEYGAPVSNVERDVYEFCLDLLERGLIEIDRNGHNG